MSHNTTLRRTAQTNTRACTDRIVRLFEQATFDQRATGLRWYDTAHYFARSLPTPTLAHAATVIAHTSPRAKWRYNQRAAWHIAHGLAVPSMPVLRRGVEAAERSLHTPDPLATLHGPKIRAFASNILGDTDAVTIDVWAARIALRNLEPGALWRDKEASREVFNIVANALAHAYRTAAARVGETPAHVQAITWIVARGTAL